MSTFTERASNYIRGQVLQACMMTEEQERVGDRDKKKIGEEEGGD